MDTAAACRTYNVLLAEGRSVVAALLFSRALSRAALDAHRRRPEAQVSSPIIEGYAPQRGLLTRAS